MGTWGAKLYQDDLALDIKEEYKLKLREGKTNDQALKEIIKMYKKSIEDSDEAPIFWMVLADTMWNLGRLTKEVKERAIQEIDKGHNLEVWKEDGDKKEYEIRKKELKEKMLYLGNYNDIESPPKEYEELIKNNISYYPYNDIEYFILHDIITLGTSKNPIYIEQDPINIMDSQIRFLMREKYYEEALQIKPKKGSYIQEDALLYISLIDSMMIGGFVQNPVGPLTSEMKEKAYKKINELRIIIKENPNQEKVSKLNILDELEKKIREF